MSKSFSGVNIHKVLKIHVVNFAGRQLKIAELAKTESISTERINYILMEDLTIKKHWCQWVLYLLTMKSKFE